MKISFDFNIKVGGSAGHGLQTIGSTLGKTFVRGGFHVFTIQDYLSRIRGGHNFFQLRISDRPIVAMREPLNMLIALDMTSITEHKKELEQGVIIADGEELSIKDSSISSVPFRSLAEEVGDGIYANTVAAGAALGLLCFGTEHLEEVLNDTFTSKGKDVVEKNIQAARKGYEYAQSNFQDRCQHTATPKKIEERRMLISGNEAAGLGALASDLKFLSAYPMTPSTGVLNYVASKADTFNVVVEQAEDEISALNMCIGASFAGVRSMTTTSGGGFSLMAEALGLAGMTETPVVIFEAQRPGPATGLPTRTEQGDLEFVLHAAQGEFPRCILAPGSAADAFYLTSKAFNIADKYQTPVIILGDQYLGDSLFTCERFDTSRIKVERHIITDAKAMSMKKYRRYEITPSGISPRALPGQGGLVVVADSDEHDEEGHITEDLEQRVRMTDKRLRKLEKLKKEISHPRVYGPEDADVTLIGWGSTYGPLAESVDILEGKANLIHYTEIYPLPKNPSHELLDGCMTLCVENNATGQFARLLRSETGHDVSKRMLKYDGRPFTPDHIIREMKNMDVI